MLRLAFASRTPDGHREHIAQRLRNARVTAIADPNIDTARSNGSTLGAEVAVCSFDELLAGHSDAFDAVALEDADEQWREHAIRAAAAGKHVLLQSSQADSRADAEGLIAACREARGRLIVGNELRFVASSRIIKAGLDDGKLGAPGLLRIHRWGSCSLGGIPCGGTRSDGSRLAIPFKLLGEIDLACWYFGGMPERIYAVCDRHSEGRESDPDYVQLHLGYSGGGMALIDYRESLPGEERYFSQSMIGSTGAAYADDHHNRQLLFGHGGATALGDDPAGDAALRNVQEFVDAVGGGREPAVTTDDVLRALDVAEAAQSAIQIRDAVCPGSDP
jgi:predicted dehydrogenase